MLVDNAISIETDFGAHIVKSIVNTVDTRWSIRHFWWCMYFMSYSYCFNCSPFFSIDLHVYTLRLIGWIGKALSRSSRCYDITTAWARKWPWPINNVCTTVTYSSFIRSKKTVGHDNVKNCLLINFQYIYMYIYYIYIYIL